VPLLPPRAGRDGTALSRRYRKGLEFTGGPCPGREVVKDSGVDETINPEFQAGLLKSLRK
jgi:hypothetical protein